MSRKKPCPKCHEEFTLKTVKRHILSGCTRRERTANHRKALENAQPSQRRHPLLLRLHLHPPTSTGPPLIGQQPRGQKRKRTNPTALPDANVVPPPPDAHLRSSDFAFDTPGAGPSHMREAGQAPTEPGLRPFEDDWDENLLLDSDSDDGRPDGPSLADNAPWLRGLTSGAILAQELEAKIAQAGGRKLTDDELKTVRAFNYKVDTNMSARAYDKLPRAFPDELGNLPQNTALRTRIAQLSGMKGIRIDCCVNSCMAFTGPFADLDYCLHCRETRYRQCREPSTKPSARKFFQYLPLIPRLINMYRRQATAEALSYRSARKTSPGVVQDIFNGEHYKRLCRSRVIVKGKALPFNYFSLPTDIALGLSSDGFGPFKSQKKTCWPLLVFNYNLSPRVRFRLENLLCLGVIPGPLQPKNIGSFLQPLIAELEDLARGVPAYDAQRARAFSLRAYLIACFGDMPAVAKLMCMKGHNGKHPCRACHISGVRNPNPAPGEDGKTNYTPLARPFVTGRHAPHQLDPLNLPHRSHTQFILHAKLVEAAGNDAEEDRRSRHYGINELSPLAQLASLDFPSSFPHDFMHAIFENVLPLLIDLWTHGGKCASFGTGREQYILDPNTWSAIGAACAQSGDTIPSAFGCRVPNIALEHKQTTAESTLLFATLLAPALLRDRFESRRYYTHFLDLVRLLNLCMGLQLARRDIATIRNGFAKWVVDFERLYYQHLPNRMRVCTLPIHSLLHIADDIKMMGPVWCYWAFPMERYCGALGRANLNPWFPYASLDRRVLEVSQLSQIKHMYDMFDTLDLGDRRHAIAEGTRYTGYPDLIFVRPRRTTAMDTAMAKRVSLYLGKLWGVERADVERHIRGREFDCWGKAQQTTEFEGMDTISGYQLVPESESARRDATFVKYMSDLDRSLRGRPQYCHGGAVTFGRVEYFLVIDSAVVEELQHDLGINATDNSDSVSLCQPLALAAISPISSFKWLRDCHLATYEPRGNLAPIEFVDARNIAGLVGHVLDGSRGSYIVDRDTVVGNLDIADAVVDPS